MTTKTSLSFILAIVTSLLSLASYSQTTPETGNSAAPPNNQAPANAKDKQIETKAKAKSTTLYGRIEEIVAGPGAKLPYVLKALKPKFDTSLSGSISAKGTTPKYSGLVVSSFPNEFKGVWQGTLTIFASEYAQGRYVFDPKEATKEKELTAPGTQGSVSFEFSEPVAGNIVLQPTQITFTAPMDQAKWQDTLTQLQSTSPTLKGLFGGADLSQIAQIPGMQALIASVPYMYALHLGAIQNGMGVTGNTLNSEIVKNEIRKLSASVIEQQLVIAEQVRNPQTGKTRIDYSENVVRFYKQSDKQLYVQAACIGYNQQGIFQDKLVLYGTVQRAQ